MNFSSYFNILNHGETFEFFDINVETDTKKFVDPYCIARSSNPHCRKMNETLDAFMSRLMSAIIQKNHMQAHSLCSNFNEPKGTGIGYSKNKLDGRGAADKLSEVFLQGLRDSIAVARGYVKRIEECGIFCEGIDRDIISDITINITRKHLITFTQEQCQKYGIPMRRTDEKIVYFCEIDKEWKFDYFELPHVAQSMGQTEQYIILIPEDLLPRFPTYGYRYFFTNIATMKYKLEAIKENLSCVFKSKKGVFRVNVKQMRLIEKYQCSKINLNRFLNSYPNAIEEYRKVADLRYKKNFPSI